MICPLPIILWLMMRGDITTLNAVVAALVSLVPLIGIAAGLNGYVAMDTSRLKALAVTGEAQPTVGAAICQSGLAVEEEVRGGQHMTPRFDPTVNLGRIITLAGFLAAICGGWYLTDHRLSSLERNFDKLSTVVIDNARTDERLKEHGRRLDLRERR